MAGIRARTRTRWWGAVLDAPDAHDLARFYGDLLGWRVESNGPDFATIHPGDGVAYLAFQTSEGYVAPTWPNAEGHQQMMLHLDIAVDEVDSAVAEALDLGATLAEHQPQDTVRVMLDPAGHPFCLYLDTDP